MFGGSSWNVEVFLDVAIPTLVLLYGITIMVYV